MIHSDIPFRHAAGRDLLLDLYLPDNVVNPPLVVYIPASDMRWCPRKSAPVWLVEYGFAMAVIECRLCPEVIAPIPILDCKAAIRWLRAHADNYGYDGSAIGVWGHSAGGLLSAIVATSGDAPALRGDGDDLEVSDAVQACCDECGVPHDLMFFARPDIKEGFGPVDDNITLYLGGPVEEKEELARLASSTTYISKQCPPMLLIQGDEDPAVPPEEMEAFHEALTAAGVDSTLKLLPGVGHSWEREMTESDIVKFFKNCLTKKL